MNIGNIFDLILNTLTKGTAAINQAQPTVVTIVNQTRDLAEVGKSLFEGKPADPVKLAAAEVLRKSLDKQIAEG